MDKIALIMISALLALTLSSCSKPRTISGHGKSSISVLPFTPSLRTVEDPHPPNQPIRHSGGGILQTILQEQLRLPSAMAEKFGDSCAKQEENHPYIYLKSFHALVKRSDSAKAEFVYREALGTPPASRRSSWQATCIGIAISSRIQLWASWPRSSSGKQVWFSRNCPSKCSQST